MLITGTVALWSSYWGWLARRPYDRRAHFANRAFLDVLSLQFLLGLVLYAVSPLVRIGLGDLGTAMGVKELRFFAVEHITGMLIAITLVHVGAMRVRRAGDERTKFREAVIWQTLAVASILISLPWWRPLLRA